MDGEKGFVCSGSCRINHSRYLGLNNSVSPPCKSVANAAWDTGTAPDVGGLKPVEFNPKVLDTRGFSVMFSPSRDSGFLPPPEDRKSKLAVGLV